jgi:hypothetical protein
MSGNAVKAQTRIAVSVHALVAIVKKRLNPDASLYILLPIVSVTLFEKRPLQQAPTPSATTQNRLDTSSRLLRFDS